MFKNKLKLHILNFTNKPLKMRNLIILFATSLLLSSCKFSCDLEDMDKPANDTNSISKQNQNIQENIANNQNNLQQNSSQGSQQNSNEKETISLQWFFNETGKAEFDAPVTEIYLVVNGQKNLIAKENMLVSETPSELFAEYEIPKDALASCRGWWAGGGNDYWVIPGTDGLEIYQRWIEEGSGPDAPAEVGKPELVKKIKN